MPGVRRGRQLRVDGGQRGREHRLHHLRRQRRDGGTVREVRRQGQDLFLAFI